MDFTNYLTTLNKKQLNVIKNIYICGCEYKKKHRGKRSYYTCHTIYNCNYIMYMNIMSIKDSTQLKDIIITSMLNQFSWYNSNIVFYIIYIIFIIFGIIGIILRIIFDKINILKLNYIPLLITMVILILTLISEIIKLFQHNTKIATQMNLLQFLEQSDVLTNKHKIEICKDVIKE